MHKGVQSFVRHPKHIYVVAWEPASLVFASQEQHTCVWGGNKAANTLVHCNLQPTWWHVAMFKTAELHRE